MASRTFYQYRYSLEPEVVELWLTVLFGATGSVTTPNGLQSFSTPGGVATYAPAPNGFNGVATVTRTSAGVFVATFTPGDTYRRVISFDSFWDPGTGVLGAAQAAPYVELYDSNVLQSASTGSIIFTTGTVKGVAGSTDPTNGTQVTIHMALSNSSAT